MGRFGNQADHLLGALSFANKLDRTLVLPRWPTNMGFVEFDKWFKIDVLKTYHKVLTAEDFMRDVAPTIWPAGKRIGFCYQPYHGSQHSADVCDLKEGSPFGPFWDNLKVDFDSTLLYSLSYSKEDARSWNLMYPAAEYPVIALKGAPASFPVKSENVHLQKYIWWTDKMVASAIYMLHNALGDSRYIAVHLRNGEDWERGCQHAVGNTKFMSSPQCTGYSNTVAITRKMCLPDTAHITKKLREAVVETKISNIYILTDQHPLLAEIETALSDLGVKAVHGDPSIPQYDLIVAAKADLFVGNCISSFSAFVKRERDFLTRKPTWFFGIERNR